MILRHNKRSVPLLNTTSTADISFILLVFFLVMTSMDVDKGLPRRLPPLDNSRQEMTSDVVKGNVLELDISSSGELLENGKPLDVNRLRAETITFISKKADRKKHVIMLSVDRNAPYDSYFNVQNELVAAYNVLRNSCAKKLFGRSYAECTPGQKDKVRDYYPQRIYESQTENGKEVAE